MAMKILLVGKGGKESAIAATLLKSPLVETLYMAPCAMEGAVAIEVDPLDFAGLEAIVADVGIDIVIVGSEQAIVEGITDAITPAGAVVIAPDRSCARLEGSKEFAKEFMFRHAIPTARFMTVTADTIDEGYAFLESLTPPYVLKADGLASGKGVILTQSLADAKDILSDMIDGLFDEASRTVVIEECLHGCELTVTLAVDGSNYLILPPAKDYKRLHEQGEGPNTRGMGAISPVSFADKSFMEKVERRIIQPTLSGLAEEGMNYTGFLYLGLIMVDGEPMLMEYNVRLGDPETEAILPRIESDFAEVIAGLADHSLATRRISVSDDACCAVTVTAEGYPGTPRLGDEILGIERARSVANVYPAMLREDEQGRRFVSGGRVAIVSALATTLDEACRKATLAASMIEFPGRFYRRDIGTRVEEPN